MTGVLVQEYHAMQTDRDVDNDYSHLIYVGPLDHAWLHGFVPSKWGPALITQSHNYNIGNIDLV